jgi:hypothetical protein
MLPLSDLQRQLRNAVVAVDVAEADKLRPFLVGGHEPLGRLAIHRRHYETSLVAAIMDKFPAATWFTGGTFMSEAARDFVHRHPPRVPCIADYGADFPQFLGDRTGAARLPYLRAFAELEWCVGRSAIAVDEPPLGLSAFADHAATLVDVRLVLQPGVHHLTADWPIDDLMRLYLSDAAPDRYAFGPSPVHLEVRGARGEFQIARLDPACFQFRSALACSESIGTASEAALEKDPTFDPGQALANLVVSGLVTALARPHRGQR